MHILPKQENDTYTDRTPGFVDIAMHVMEALNNQAYNVSEDKCIDGGSIFRLYLKGKHGQSAEMVAVVTYNPQKGSIFVQQVRSDQPAQALRLPIAA